jgi:predicted RNase H-like HicB family nuclease
MNTTLDKKRFTYWQDGDMWLGYLEDYPDYWTQGESETELRENLLDLYKDLNGGMIPNVRKVAELEIS